MYKSNLFCGGGGGGCPPGPYDLCFAGICFFLLPPSNVTFCMKPRVVFITPSEMNTSLAHGYIPQTEQHEPEGQMLFRIVGCYP